MDANISIGEHSAAGHVEKITSVQPLSTQTPLRENHAHIQTATDLKKAEMQGEHIPISEEQLIKAIDRAIKSMRGANTQLEFSIHERTKQIMVKVVNSETGELVREIPPEKTLDLVAKLWEMAGILIDERR